MAVQGGIDCDVHPNVPRTCACSRATSTTTGGTWSRCAASTGSRTSSYPPLAPLSARPDWREPGSQRAALRRRAAARGAPRPLAAGGRDPQLPLRRPADHTTRTWPPPSPAPSTTGSSPSGSTPSRGFGPRSWCRRRTRSSRSRRSSACAARPAVRPGAAAGRWATCRSASASTGRSTRAAERHGLPIGIHLGSAYRHAGHARSAGPATTSRTTSTRPQAFQGQLASLVSHGVFDKFPRLKVVLIESGVTWLPAFLWRFSKSWRGLRDARCPGSTGSPLEIVREHVRLTLQPLDAPPGPSALARVIDQLGSDEMLLFSSDYPHWQFEGDEALPPGLPSAPAAQDPGRQPAARPTRGWEARHDAWSCSTAAGPRPRPSPEPAGTAGTAAPASSTATSTRPWHDRRPQALPRRQRWWDTSRPTASAAARHRPRATPTPRRHRAPRAATPGRPTADRRAATSRSCASTISSAYEVELRAS